MSLNKSSRMIAFAAGALLVTVGVAAADTSVTATTDLNVRAGPGTQYPVIGVIGAGQNAMLTGCVKNSRWCAVDEGGKPGFVYSSYLTADIGGAQVVITERPAEAGVVYIDPPAEGSIKVMEGATGSIRGELIGPVGHVDMIDPPDTVRTYVTSNRVEPVYLEGEVVVGAGLPDTVELVDIPEYDYRYVYVNGQPALVEPSTRRIVYVYR
ncbi:DUF1236 domain-containing protein [Arvimicrobium flavum]|uniref:DUF1236 domain-containing protein n=1 Tax=Arvimicrobium flavum TaxID=3393320 RepID=UPI00237A905B|nr:DUF1236 domain-containing protein [Mesorhizobium shangrilense]